MKVGDLVRDKGDDAILLFIRWDYGGKSKQMAVCFCFEEKCIYEYTDWEANKYLEVIGHG